MPRAGGPARPPRALRRCNRRCRNRSSARRAVRLASCPKQRHPVREFRADRVAMRASQPRSRRFPSTVTLLSRSQPEATRPRTKMSVGGRPGRSRRTGRGSNSTTRLSTAVGHGAAAARPATATPASCRPETQALAASTPRQNSPLPRPRAKTRLSTAATSSGWRLQPTQPRPGRRSLKMSAISTAFAECRPRPSPGSRRPRAVRARLASHRPTGGAGTTLRSSLSRRTTALNQRTATRPVFAPPSAAACRRLPSARLCT